MEGGIHEGPVLFAYDGFEDAKAAIRQAGRHLKKGRRAVVLTVWEPLRSTPTAREPELAPVARENPIERAARSVADEGARLARLSGFDAEAIAERGDPVWERIVQSAEERDASVVVLGAHGCKPTKPGPMGSVATAAAEHTRRPVLIVHAPPPRRHG
jgi:nucleotide-binding universal stress UspA family protein